MRVCEVCRARFEPTGRPSRCPLDGGALVPLPDPLIGRTIGGRYVIEEKVGAGGMGTVYRARHEIVGRDIALKFLSPELTMDPTNRKRFLREAKAANRINHEHIIDITDFGETDDGLVFLVMEYLHGVPLSAEIANGPMPQRRALRIVLQASTALARAHELDVIHRDIKSDNIYLLDGYEDDFVKLLDFGLAHMKGELRITATGMVFGTPEYMPPEQAQGAALTPATDLYSLGCVLYELLTGRLPFQGSIPDLVLAHMRKAPPLPSSVATGLSPDIDALVMKLLAKDPARRHADAHHLAEDLKRLLARQYPSEASFPRSTLPRGGAGPSQTIPLRTLHVEHAWEERVALLRGLVPRAYPGEVAPQWLVSNLDELEERVRTIRSLRNELADRASQATKHEEELREARLRIGRAIDELARDDSRLQREVGAAEGRVSEMRARLSEIAGPLMQAWGAIPSMPDGGELDDAVAEAIELAAPHAASWRAANALLRECEEELHDKQREREDLEFQISQLKGRLGTLNAVSDVRLTGLREATSGLDSQIQEQIDAIVRSAEPVVKHFLTFRDLRDIVLGTPSSSEAAR